MDIRNSIALVLGSTKGIGKAIALDLADAGASVIIPYYDWPQDSQQTIDQFTTLGSKHLTCKTDLRDPAQIKNLLALIKKKYGKLDILINNIERGGMPVVHGAYTPEQWDLEFDTTLKAKWWVFNEALPLLQESTSGVVINLSSIAGEVGRSGTAGLVFNEGYAAANRAVSSFTETWARQAAPKVRVNELVLGFIKNRHAEGTRGWQLLSAAEKQGILQQTLLQRTGDMQEVVAAVKFIIKDAEFMTGCSICLDGGYRLGHSRVPEMPEGEDNLDILL